MNKMPLHVAKVCEDTMEDITQTVIMIMEELWLNWSQLGIDNETIKDRIQMFVHFPTNFHEDVRSETQDIVNETEKTIITLEEEVKELCKYLAQDSTVLDFKDKMKPIDYKNKLTTQIIIYKDHVRVRKLKSTLLLDWQRELANHLDFAIWVLPDVPLPSENYLKKFRKYLTGLQIEKQKRADFILQKHFEITDIMRLLQIKPQNKLEEILMSTPTGRFKMTDRNIDLLAKMHQNLQEKYVQINKKVYAREHRPTTDKNPNYISDEDSEVTEEE